MYPVAPVTADQLRVLELVRLLVVVTEAGLDVTAAVVPLAVVAASL